MKLLSLLAAGLLLAAAPQVHAQAAQQPAKKPTAVASTRTAHAASMKVAQQAQTPADTTHKAHKSAKKSSRSAKVATASKSGHTRHASKGSKSHMKAKADTAKKGL